MVGKYGTVEQLDSIRRELGLDVPLWKQYLGFVKQTFSFDWGTSWNTKENISSMILTGIGPSLCLTLPAFFISLFLSLFIAIFSCYKRNTWIDRLIVFKALSLMSISFLVYIISFQYFLAYKFGLFEINGWDESWLYRWNYLVLPWIISVCVATGPKVLLFRSALISELDQDYVRTARAKGIGDFSLYTRHILKNAMIPIITVVVVQLPFLFTGSLLLESFFGIPGLGDMLIQAINNSDFPVVKAITVIGALIYVAFNLIGDFLYKIFDPRVEIS